MSASDDVPDFPGSGQIAAFVTQVRALMEPILEGTVGYKKAATEAGLSEEAASRMAADYHSVVVKIMTTNLGQK